MTLKDQIAAENILLDFLRKELGFLQREEANIKTLKQEQLGIILAKRQYILKLERKLQDEPEE